jgi:hypothetical protein
MGAVFLPEIDISRLKVEITLSRQAHLRSVNDTMLLEEFQDVRVDRCYFGILPGMGNGE